MTVSEYDLNHAAPFHKAIAEFVSEIIADRPGEGFDGTFGYRIDVYRADGSTMPFIYVPDKHSQTAD
jgi:hypothetical protein